MILRAPYRIQVYPTVLIRLQPPNHSLTRAVFERMKDAGKSHKANGKASPETRKDRKSATGMNGSPKKGGHGGKFTWIGHGYSQVEMEMEHGALDTKDPNFEDPAEVAAA
ncbi:hypothetical protein VNO77_32908 [Canavalia gladiata]|uniref:Uncharacterized protein n=1 Tax=Canavalia gladiata TaxID=3824 RepID=A0AAN9PXW4_CANGL